MKEDHNVLSLLVDNEPGVLSRIVGLFSGRGYNIESLNVAETTEPGVSRVTIVTKGNEPLVEQVKKQMNKLINVLKVHDLTGSNYVHRELLLLKVRAKADNKAEILRIVDIFRCKIVDVGTEYYTIEATGNEGKLKAMMDLLRPMGIKEIARSGMLALYRESKS